MGKDKHKYKGKDKDNCMYKNNCNDKVVHKDRDKYKGKDKDKDSIP